MPDVIWNSYKADALAANVDLDADTIKLALFPSTFTFNSDTQHFWSDISGSEASGTNYTAGGNALAGKAVTIDDTDDEGVFDANDVVYSNVTITARYGVLWKDTGTPATSPLIGQLDFVSDISATAGDLTVSFNAEGVINLN
jgi:hypothetical protein